MFEKGTARNDILSIRYPDLCLYPKSLLGRVLEKETFLPEEMPNLLVNTLELL